METLKIDCPDCGGNGCTGVSNCCGAMIYDDTDICSDCHEHSDDECETCSGTGKVELKLQEA